jgi:hypothetical protein
MMTTMLRGLGVGVAAGWADEGDDGEEDPEPHAAWTSRLPATAIVRRSALWNLINFEPDMFSSGRGSDGL